MSEGIERALAQVAPALDADGFELRLEDFRPDGTVQIALAAGPDACAECLMPDDVLHQVLQDAITREEPRASAVVLRKDFVHLRHEPGADT